MDIFGRYTFVMYICLYNITLRSVSVQYFTITDKWNQ